MKMVHKAAITLLFAGAGIIAAQNIPNDTLCYVPGASCDSMINLIDGCQENAPCICSALNSYQVPCISCLVSVSATNEASEYQSQVGYCSSSFGAGSPTTTGGAPAVTTATTTGSGTGATGAKIASSAAGSTPTAAHSGGARVIGSMGLAFAFAGLLAYLV